ncbi:MAG TPA: hypothetical protein VFS81_14650, partial [Candidatus Binatia bacterium]|nr:hypothetical protein [Candidatus Binatia bacterium]
AYRVRDVGERRSDGPTGRDLGRQHQQAIVPVRGEYRVTTNERVDTARIRIDLWSVASETASAFSP